MDIFLWVGQGIYLAIGSKGTRHYANLNFDMFTEMYVKKFTISWKFKVVSKLVWIMQEVSENLNFHADLSFMTCSEKNQATF